MKKPKILFFTPLAGRTGSEMMLAYILNHFDREKFSASIVSFADGELLKELPVDVSTYFINKNFGLKDKLKFKLGKNPIFAAIEKIQAKEQADIWYVNTITLPEVYEVAKRFGVKIVTHFHELPLSFSILKKSDFEMIINDSDLLIGCAECVCDAIKVAGGLNVKLLYETIDTQLIRPNSERSFELKKSLGITENDTVWVMSGTTDARKGFDFLPEIAQKLDSPNHHLIWLGKNIDSGLTYYVEQKCKQITSTKIHLLGSQKEDYYNYLSLADAFLLLSREDPYPLVMIESAFLGKPIFSFKSGGVTEFLQDGMGAITENFNVNELVINMLNWKKGILKTDATISINRAKEFDISIQLEKWQKIMLTFNQI
jgi:L-malate glycosyltransferase